MLGLGNLLLHDEGIGVWVAESLRRRFDFPDTVTLLDGGTLGLDLLPRLEGVSRLCLIDAVQLGGPPGRISRLAGEEVPAALGLKMSPHQVGVQDLLATARLRGQAPPVVVLWGLEPERLDPGIGFSPSVASALTRLEAAVLEELRGWGLPGRLRAEAAPLPIWWTTPVGTRS